MHYKRVLNHGDTRNTKTGHRLALTPTYYSWMSMKNRVKSTEPGKRKSYLDRGITVCERWLGRTGFTNFLADMGERPEGTSLDRIDNDRGYEVGNCRWATAKEQANNKRNNVH